MLHGLEAKGCTVRQVWRAHTHELEIRVHKLQLLQEHVGGSNAAWVRRSSPHLPLDLPLTKGQPPVLDQPLSFPYHPIYGHIHHPYKSPYVLRAKDPKVRRAWVCITVAGLVLQGIAGSEHWPLDALV